MSLTGRKFSARFLFQPTSGSGAYGGRIFVSSSQTASAPTDAPASIPAYQWVTVTATIPEAVGTADTEFSILLLPGTWVGRVFVDNITLVKDDGAGTGTSTGTSTGTNTGTSTGTSTTIGWNFNDNTLEGWTQGGGVRGTVCAPGTVTTEIPETDLNFTPLPPSLDGTPALAWDVNGSTSGCGAGIGVQFGGNGVSLSGRKFSARILFEPTGGSGSYGGKIAVWSTQTGSALTDAPASVPAYQWVTVTATIAEAVGTTDTQFGILLFPGSWTGRVFVDNIALM